MRDMQRPWMSWLRPYEPRPHQMLEADDRNRNVARRLCTGSRQMDEIEHSVAGQSEQRLRDCGSRIPNAGAMRRRERMHGAHDRRRQPFNCLCSNGSTPRENAAITPGGHFWSERRAHANQLDITVQPRETDVA